MKQIPLLFMGSPAVAVTVLKGLVEKGHEVRAVITQPDKPAGRGQHLTPPPVKVYAASQNIPVLQPTKMKDPELILQLRSYEPQAIIVAAYGRLIPKEILEIPPWGCLNVHFSLLPQYRGASCVASAIRNGEKETGVSIMQIDERLDAGPVLKQEKWEIGPEETTGGLEEKLGPQGARLMLEVLEDLKKGRCTPKPQNESAATYAPLIKKEEGHIDWTQSAQKIHDLIRAFIPWPVAFTYIDKIRIKVYFSKIVPLTPPLSLQGRGRSESPLSLDGEGEKMTGQIVNLNQLGIEVACGEGRLLLTEVQPESKKKMSAWDFAQGHRDLVKVGKRLE